MHVVLLVAFPPGWDPSDLREVMRPVGEHGIPLAVWLPPDLIDQVDPSDLPTVEWVRAGHGAPRADYLPPGLLAEAIRMEAERLDQAGFGPGPFWLRAGWTERLLPLLDPARPSCLMVEGVAGSGTVAFFDRVFPALGIEVDPDPPALAIPDDRVTVWRVEPSRLEEYASWVAARPGCTLTVPSRFLADHRVEGRLRLPVEPTPQDRLERRLARIKSLAGSRPPGEVVTACAGAVGHGVIASEDRLVAASAMLERARRKEGPPVVMLDWDADGSEEAEIRSPEVEMVVHSSGAILTFDLLAQPVALGAVPGEAPGCLCRHLAGSEHPTEPGPYRLEAQAERLVARGEGVTIEVEPDADSVHLSYRFDGLPSGLAGPDLVLALGRTEIRVDGNDRGEISEPVAVGGHRYRLSGEKAEILIESPLPSQLFARPAEGGVVVWLHWVISPEADYRARLRIVRSTS